MLNLDFLTNMASIYNKMVRPTRSSTIMARLMPSSANMYLEFKMVRLMRSSTISARLKLSSADTNFEFKPLIRLQQSSINGNLHIKLSIRLKPSSTNSDNFYNKLVRLMRCSTSSMRYNLSTKNSGYQLRPDLLPRRLLMVVAVLRALLFFSLIRPPRGPE